MSDSTRTCPFCGNTGWANGRICLCPVGLAWRASPRVTIGNETLVFPPGTSMDEAGAVVEEAKRLHREQWESGS